VIAGVRGTRWAPGVQGPPGGVGAPVASGRAPRAGLRAGAGAQRGARARARRGAGAARLRRDNGPQRGAAHACVLAAGVPRARHSPPALAAGRWATAPPRRALEITSQRPVKRGERPGAGRPYVFGGRAGKHAHARLACGARAAAGRPARAAPRAAPAPAERERRGAGAGPPRAAAPPGPRPCTQPGPGRPAARHGRTHTTGRPLDAGCPAGATHTRDHPPKTGPAGPAAPQNKARGLTFAIRVAPGARSARARQPGSKSTHGSTDKTMLARAPGPAAAATGSGARGSLNCGVAPRLRWAGDRLDSGPARGPSRGPGGSRPRPCHAHSAPHRSQAGARRAPAVPQVGPRIGALVVQQEAPAAPAKTATLKPPTAPARTSSERRRGRHSRPLRAAGRRRSTAGRRDRGQVGGRAG
jgi:hypothetical protein